MKTRAFIVAALVLSGCDYGPADIDGAQEGTGALGFVVSAVTDNCSGNPGIDPTQEIRRLVAEVYGRDKETGERVLKADEVFDVQPGANTLTVSGVPAGTQYDVKLRGYPTDDLNAAPAWFGQRRQVSVTQDQANPLEMVLVRFGAFTCLDPPTSFTERIFPAIVRLNDGRILITGGFTRATVDPLTPSQITLESPSNVAVIYDPFTGQTVQTQNTMVTARAGHAAVFLPLPDDEKVLIFGGTTKMSMRLDGSFPFSIDGADSLNSYEVFDLKTMSFSAAGDDKDGHPKQMQLKRAFPAAVRLFDNSILVAGGGKWPGDLDDYRRAEIWLPEEDGGKGGMQDLGAASPQMESQHNVAAVTKLEDTTDGLSRYIFLGGTGDAANVLEVYTQSSRQKEGVSGIFTPLEAPGMPGTYFGSITPLTPLVPTAQKKFVAIGGLSYSGGQYAVSDKAYVLSLDPGDKPKVTVEAIASAPCAARFMHTASPTFVPGKAVVLGGYADFTGVAGSETCMFSLVDGKGMFTQLAAGQEAFVSRSGHGTQLLDDDSLLVVGGMVSKDTLSGDKKGMLEIYAHPWIDLN